MTTLRVEPIQPWIGAEICGVDLRDPLDDTTREAIAAAFRRHKVLVFRDQPIDQAHHKRFARTFGIPEAHPALELSEHPEIVPIRMSPDMALFGQLQDWHTDVTYVERPPAAGFLIGREIPPLGGDTVFANAAKAFALLDAPLRTRLRGLRAVHVPDFENYVQDAARRKALHERNPPREHPMVVVHPQTGEECLYVNEHFTRSVVGLTAAESDRLLAQLYRHLAHPEFHMRVRWQRHTLVMWDEVATQHYAVTDYDTPRYLERITIAGKIPRGAEADVAA